MTKEQLKDLVKGHFNLVEISENFAEATLEDGTKVTNDIAGELAEGQALKVITEDGEKVSAPEGDHVTESGIVITVDAEGIITGLKRPDEEGEGSADLAEEVETIETEMAEETVTEEMSAEETAESTEESTEEAMAEQEEDETKMEEMPSLEEIIEVVGDAIEEKMAKYDEKIKMMEDEVKDIKDKMSAFASEPAEEKTVPVSGKKFASHAFATVKAEKTYNQLLKKMKNK
jgi:hypothetical protein